MLDLVPCDRTLYFKDELDANLQSKPKIGEIIRMVHEGNIVESSNGHIKIKDYLYDKCEDF
ncbi:MAG: hypothetical protein R3Y64_06625 [Peptostreptococcaceae bacterium]